MRVVDLVIVAVICGVVTAMVVPLSTALKVPGVKVVARLHSSAAKDRGLLGVHHANDVRAAHLHLELGTV